MEYVARYVLLAALLITATLACSRSHFEGRLRTGDGIYIADLERSPVWSPPPPPDYSTFRSKFDDLPPHPSPDFKIVRVHKWGQTVLDIALWLAVIGGVAAVAYFPFRSRLHDPILHLVSWIGIGLAGSVVLNIGVWVLVGGWGAPAPLLFAAIGVLGGTGGAVTTWPPGSPNQRS